MKEFAEKLIERLENRMEYNKACHEEFPNAKMSLVYEVQINAYKNAIEIVKDLASEHNNGWIPCSERLPEISQNVLWTVNKENHPDAPFDIIIGAYHLNLDYDIWKDWCTAWMPLPEPYKKGE